MQSLCQGKGQRSHKAKNRRKHFRGGIGRAISNLVAVLVSDLWAMAGKNGTVFFQQLAAILNVPFRPNWLLNFFFFSFQHSFFFISIRNLHHFLLHSFVEYILLLKIKKPSKSACIYAGFHLARLTPQTKFFNLG